MVINNEEQHLKLEWYSDADCKLSFLGFSEPRNKRPAEGLVIVLPLVATEVWKLENKSVDRWMASHYIYIITMSAEPYICVCEMLCVMLILAESFCQEFSKWLLWGLSLTVCFFKVKSVVVISVNASLFYWIRSV